MSCIRCFGVLEKILFMRILGADTLEKFFAFGKNYLCLVNTILLKLNEGERKSQRRKREFDIRLRNGLTGIQIVVLPRKDNCFPPKKRQLIQRIGLLNYF